MALVAAVSNASLTLVRKSCSTMLSASKIKAISYILNCGNFIIAALRGFTLCFVVVDVVAVRDTTRCCGFVAVLVFLAAFCVLSLLSMVALSRYQDSKAIVKKLKNMGVFPLHQIPWISSAGKKVSIINFSPRLFCWMLHLKDKK